MVKPEQLSLTAHHQITTCLENLDGQNSFSDKDINAVLRLSQHLRIFGLLSAIRYINTSNDQDGNVRERTVPIWRSLLAQLIFENPGTEATALRNQIVNVANQKPEQYMQLWRKSLALANHWNFWARAYKSESPADNQNHEAEVVQS